MKVNSIPSFGALMVNKKGLNAETKKNVTTVISNPELEEKAIYHLESLDSDLYVEPKLNGDVDLRVRRDAGLFYNFTPTDKQGSLNITLKAKTIANKNKLSNEIAGFVSRIMHFNKQDLKSDDNKRRADFFEMLAERDMMSKNPETVSQPNNLPDATYIFGTDKVTTRDFIRHLEEASLRSE